MPKNRIVAGIDVGSMTAKTAIINGKRQLLGSSVVMAGVMNLDSARDSFHNALTSSGLQPDDVRYIVSTGYGREQVPFAQKNMSEISCHARGARLLFPGVRTVIDIGGQDSKVVGLDERGIVDNFVMNDKCAAGTGRFLEVMAHAMGLDLPQMAELSLQAKKEVHVSSICTVFAESEVISLVSQRHSKADVLSGINQAIARRIASLAERVGVKEPVVMTGGVAKNKGVVNALEDILGVSLLIPPEPQIVGALGAALLALEELNSF